MNTQLNRNWTLFFHAKDKTKNYDDNTIFIININTIKDFWGTFNNTPKPSELFYDGKILKGLKLNGTIYVPNAFSFFEKGVKPSWDDPNNIYGAEWSIRKFNELEEISNMWMIALTDLLSESFKYSQHIKGIRIVDSTLPGKPMYRLEYWFDSLEFSEQISSYIKSLFNIKTNLLYREHSTTKEA